MESFPEELTPQEAELFVRIVKTKSDEGGTFRALLDKLMAHTDRALSFIDSTSPESAFAAFLGATKPADWCDAELRGRKGIAMFSVLIRMGLASDGDERVEQTWKNIAACILSQKSGREDEARKIMLEALERSLVKFGPVHKLLPVVVPVLPSIASTFVAQKQFPLAERVLRFALVLAKFDNKFEPTTIRIRHDLVGVLRDLRDYESAASFALEALDAFEQSGPAAREAIWILGTGRALTLLHFAVDLRRKRQRYDWASYLLERALPMKLREDVHGNPRKLAKPQDKIDYLLMGELGLSLFLQGKLHPEKYKQAESVHRDLLSAKLKDKSLSPEHTTVLATMDDLSEDLACQGKFVEALTLCKQSAAAKKRMHGEDSSGYKKSIQRQTDYEERQDEFCKKAEQRFGPRHMWTQTEDAVAGVLFRGAVDESRKKQGYSRKQDLPSCQYTRTADAIRAHRDFLPYNPADLQSTLRAALLVLLGVKTKDDLESGKTIFFTQSKGTNETTLPAEPATLSWVALVKAFKTICVDVGDKRGLKDQEKQAVTAMEHIYNSLLQQASAAEATAEETAAHSTEVREPQESSTELKQPQYGSKCFSLGSGDERHSAVCVGLGELFKSKTCMGCGLQAPSMRCCARCRQAHACSKECLASAWQEHKKTCVPVGKQKV